MQDYSITTPKRLAACEASLKRWHSRLTRASNMVAKLEKKRRRLALINLRVEQAEKTKHIPPPPPLPAETVAELKAVNAELQSGLAIPAFLNRADPLIAEKMTAARKKAEEAARHKMPLTGRAAIDAIMAVPVKPKRKRVSAAK
jgi:hypothetical protein